MPAPPLTLAAIRQSAFLYDADGTIAEANERAEALAGRPLAGSTAVAVVGILDIRSRNGALLEPSDLPALRALAGAEAVDVPLTVTGADGRTVHVLITASSIRAGANIVGALECWQDVSAFVEARAAAEWSAEALGRQGAELARTVADLERQRGLLDAILGTLPHRVSLWGRDHRLAWANERFAAEHGRPAEALVGRSWRELGYDPAVIEPFAEETARAISAGRPCSREVEVAGPRGARWLAVTAVPIFGDSALVISEDASGRKEAEGMRVGDLLNGSVSRRRQRGAGSGHGTRLRTTWRGRRSSLTCSTFPRRKE